MQIVRCNACGWIGKDGDLGLYYGDDTEYCPRCRDTDRLMNVDSGCSFDSQEIETLWDLLGDIPVDGNDNIEEEFLGFPEGTDKMEIWMWFDENYVEGVVRLMGKERECCVQYRDILFVPGCGQLQEGKQGGCRRRLQRRADQYHNGVLE